jgi:hypothetical protein
VAPIFLDKPDYGKIEDAIRIERCRVAYFSGDGVNLKRAWVYSIRHSMLGWNRGDGLRIRGWEGFVIDNGFSVNRGAGVAAREENASVTFIGNRIEWNEQENILITAGSEYQITGNYIDRAGSCGLALRGTAGRQCSRMTITGNHFKASGKNADPASYNSAHILLEGAKGVTCVGNNFSVGCGETPDEKGAWSPSYGIVCKNLRNCVIANNVMDDGALWQLILEEDSAQGVGCKDNRGSLLKDCM